MYPERMLASLLVCLLAHAEPTFECPLDLKSKLPIVEFKVKGEPVRWIVDTGAGRSCLDAGAVKRLGLEPVGEIPAVGTGGTVKAATLGNLPVEVGARTMHLPTIGLDLVGVAEKLGSPFEGILGYEFFLPHVVELDYRQSRLRLYRRTGFVPPKGAEEWAVELSRLSPTVSARVSLPDGKTHEAKLLIDTGQNSMLGLGPEFVKRNEVHPKTGGKTALSGGVGGLGFAREGDVTAVEIGRLRFPSPATLLQPRAQGRLDGSIGSPLFQERRVFIDYSGKRIWVSG